MRHSTPMCFFILLNTEVGMPSEIIYMKYDGMTYISAQKYEQL